ncbi:SDR family NAD(P)-dependent oxidoreductase [Methylobacterium aquaticum]|uniref:Short-chain dehydrogenase n=1 Tax=Methylobacterium aquaticum TaxID=270351 RepID=A0A0J6VCU0_9HYPH|nr:SDR family oxidoreductase [Methylobacterium aquaticum]KMO36881.1 short-chain dehydrogenase [Methylobacterium aquaticum]
MPEQRDGFADKVALVTGAASGLGRAAAIALDRAGTRVVLFDRDAEGLNETAAFCANATVVAGNVTREADLVGAVDIAGRIGPLTLLATAAGTVGPLTSLEDYDAGDWDDLFAVNVKGTWLSLKAAIPALRRSGGGAIVTFSSAAGLVGSPAMPAYAATKAAIVSLTRSLARIHAPEGIRVNCVCPGSIETPMLEATFAAATSDEARRLREAEFLARHPLGRFGTVREVTEAVLFLLSERASFVTGTALPIDGGRLA